MPTVPITGTGSLDLTGEDATLAAVPTGVPPLSSSDIPDVAARLDLRTSPAFLELTREPEDPPYDNFVVLGRHQTWPDPILDANGKPTNWQDPSVDAGTIWGFMQIYVGNRDVTWYRGIPTVVESFGYSEPFSDDTAALMFPQITTLEAVPNWLGYEAPVTLVRWGLYGETWIPSILWEGFVVSVSDVSTPTEYGMRVECIGALYDQDRYLARPPLHKAPVHDIGHLIADAFYPWNWPGQRVGQMTEVATGIQSSKTGSWEPLLTGHVQELLANATTEDGNQWTVHKWPGRLPFMMLKDKTTVHWEIRCGVPGVTHDLTKDHTVAPNIYFGEGQDDSNCRWRNAVYPNLRPDDAPIFPGSIMNVGNSSAGWRLFEDELIRRGYSLSGNGVYNSGDASEVKRFQRNGGISVDGAVGPQTWAVAFEPGLDGGSLDGGFFAPLAFMTGVIPHYNGGTGGGTQAIPNPDYNPHIPRREHYINWGAGVTLSDAARSSLDLLSRNWPADWIGTITLEVDPGAGHRFDIRAGHNILFHNHHGVDRLFHIARVEVDFNSGSVTLTVDEAGRDALTLAELIQRNRDNATPTWRRDRTYRNSRAVEDRIATWDCENGSGVIPRHATYRGLWNVLRIPASAGGEIIRTELTLDTPARFAAAVFDRPMTAADLRRMGSPTDEGFWDQFGDGLVIAWGGEGQMAGYSPGAESEDAALTGALIDDAGWYYESQHPPWLWVAIWVESPTINYVRGRLYPGLL